MAEAGFLIPVNRRFHYSETWHSGVRIFFQDRIEDITVGVEMQIKYTMLKNAVKTQTRTSETNESTAGNLEKPTQTYARAHVTIRPKVRSTYCCQNRRSQLTVYYVRFITLKRT